MTDGDIKDATKTPSCSSEPVQEERGGLIKFYNTIYVGRVKYALRYVFAPKYDLSNQDQIMDVPALSPFPFIKQQLGCPCCSSQQHFIYVSPHKTQSGLTPRSTLLCTFSGSPSKTQSGLTPRSTLLCTFSGSPSKSLKDINTMIRQGEQKTKKLVLAIRGDAESLPVLPVKEQITNVTLRLHPSQFYHWVIPKLDQK